MSNIETTRKKLIIRKVELEHLMADLYSDKPENQVLDTGDQAYSSNLEELKISIHNNELNEYKMILKALKMMDEGSYGICIDCSKPIAEKRLLMFPNATRCLICQEAAEESRHSF